MKNYEIVHHEKTMGTTVCQTFRNNKNTYLSYLDLIQFLAFPLVTPFPLRYSEKQEIYKKKLISQKLSPH